MILVILMLIILIIFCQLVDVIDLNKEEIILLAEIFLNVLF